MMRTVAIVAGFMLIAAAIITINTLAWAAGPWEGAVCSLVTGLLLLLVGTVP